MSYVYSAFGLAIILAVWYSVYFSGLVSPGLLPAPHQVLLSLEELHFKDALLRNMMFSIRLNMLGYLEAVLAAVPLGFAIGLSPVLRALCSRYMDAIRFVPLTACVGLFIAWFGIEDAMKINFLAFGIFVYLLPVVVQRIDEVESVFKDTAFTLGATKWQTLKTVYFPSVFSRLSDDVRVLTAISWTYLIVAELVNKTAGIGALSFTAARQSRVDKVFAILLIIILIGIVQDRLFVWADRILFRFKFAGDGTR